MMKHGANRNADTFMKHQFFFVGLLFISIEVYSQKIKYIDINSIPLLTTTDINVPCTKIFNENFKKQLIRKHIIDFKTLSQLKKLILKFKIQRGNSIDVRGQIIIYYQNDNSRKICFNRSGDFYENGKISTNKELFIFLRTEKFISDF